MDDSHNSISKHGRVNRYFDGGTGLPVTQPTIFKTLLSRIMLPLLAILSREQSLKFKLTPLDDERVIMVLKYARGKALDIGCGANHFIKSYGNGIGVDVHPWQGVDKVIKSAADLPFKAGSFDTVSYLACLNHIPNRADSLKEANRVLVPAGRLLITMISPGWGKFIHWLRFRNDPDHQARHIDGEHELLGMDPAHVRQLLKAAGFTNITRKRFVFGQSA